MHLYFELMGVKEVQAKQGPVVSAHTENLMPPWGIEPQLWP